MRPPVPRRILVVDDDATVRNTTVSLLRAAGHMVSDADGGATGIERLADGPLDLVLTDLGMPEMTGGTSPAPPGRAIRGCGRPPDRLGRNTGPARRSRPASSIGSWQNRCHERPAGRHRRSHGGQVIGPSSAAPPGSARPAPTTIGPWKLVIGHSIRSTPVLLADISGITRLPACKLRAPIAQSAFKPDVPARSSIGRHFRHVAQFFTAPPASSQRHSGLLATDVMHLLIPWFTRLALDQPVPGAEPPVGSPAVFPG